MLIPSRAWVIVVGTGLIAAAIAVAITPMANAYWSIPLSNRASAYTLGIRLALTSDDLHAIWEGRVPATLSRSRERDDVSKYLWQEAQLVRIGNCLDLVAARTSRPLQRPAQCGERDKMEWNAARLHFRVEPDRAIAVSFADEPLANGGIIARGALIGVNGEIGLGVNRESATFFKIEFDATALDPQDVRPERNAHTQPSRTGTGGESCDDARMVRLRAFQLLSLLPPMQARLCRYRSKEGRILALVHYRSGPLQLARFTDVVMCQALLAQLFVPSPRVDAAGCLGARWNERVESAVNFVLFDATPGTHFTLFR